MSVRLMGQVFDLQVRSTEKLVLLAMADHAHDDGTGCYPSIRTLARKTSQTPRGVQKVMRRLEAAGLIVPSKVSRGYRATEYRLTLENPELRSLFPSSQHPEPGSSKPRTTGPRTPNAVTKYPEPGSPEPLGAVREPSGKLAAQSAARLRCTVENEARPKALAESQADYANLGKLLPEAARILARAKDLGKQHADADCREELKQFAASHRIPYHHDAISKAFDVEEARATR